MGIGRWESDGGNQLVGIRRWESDGGNQTVESVGGNQGCLLVCTYRPDCRGHQLLYPHGSFPSHLNVGVENIPMVLS